MTARSPAATAKFTSFANGTTFAYSGIVERNLMKDEEPPMNDRVSLLDVRSVSLDFDGVRAVDELSFDVARGEVCAIIGPNGAGKSSVVNIISGLYRPAAGKVRFDGL